MIVLLTRNSFLASKIDFVFELEKNTKKSMVAESSNECPYCERTSAECPHCGEIGHVMDGPSNSDIPTTCPHYLCMHCWEEIYRETIDDESLATCPICEINVSNWLICHYGDIEEDENNASEEDENDDINDEETESEEDEIESDQENEDVDNDEERNVKMKSRIVFVD